VRLTLVKNSAYEIAAGNST